MVAEAVVRLGNFIRVTSTITGSSPRSVTAENSVIWAINGRDAPEKPAFAITVQINENIGQRLWDEKPDKLGAWSSGGDINLYVPPHLFDHIWESVQAADGAIRNLIATMEPSGFSDVFDVINVRFLEQFMPATEPEYRGDRPVPPPPRSDPIIGELRAIRDYLDRFVMWLIIIVAATMIGTVVQWFRH